MAYKLAVATCKGGVAKTATAVNVADQLMLLGKKVLLIDTDPRCASTLAYGAESNGVATLDDIMTGGYKAKQCLQKTSFGDIIAGDELLFDADRRVQVSPNMYYYIQDAIEDIEKEYDYIVFDTPPEMGILLGNVLAVADGIISPVMCDGGTIKGLAAFNTFVNEFKRINKSIKTLGFLRVVYNPREAINIAVSDALVEYSKQLDTVLFNTTIRKDVKVKEATTLQKRLSEYDAKCRGFEDYKSLVAELQERYKI